LDTIEETFAFEYQCSKANNCGRIPFAHGSACHGSPVAAKRPKSLPLAATNGNGLPLLRGNQFHICLAIQAHDPYHLCGTNRVATARALILTGVGLSHSSTQVNAVAVMGPSTWDPNAVTLVTVQLNVNQISGQQPLQQPVTWLCDAEAINRVLFDNQSVFLCDLFEQPIMVRP
jgi:hypothetical protein